MSLRSKGIAAMKWSSITAITVTISQLLQFGIVSHFLGPVEYGLFGMITTIVWIFSAFGDMGFSNAIIKNQRISSKHISSLYVFNITVAAAIGLAIWLLTPLIAAFYGEPRLVEPIHWMALICFIPAIGQTFEAIFQKELKFETIAKADILANLISFSVATVGAYLGYGLYALVWSFLANTSTKALLMVILGSRLWRPELHFSWSEVKGYMSYGLYQTGTSITNVLNGRLDYLILGSTLGAESLGYYMFASQLCQIPMQKLNPMVWQVTLPLYARIQDQVELLRKGYLQMISMISYVIAPIFFGIIATAPLFVPLLFGDEWIPSILIMQILSGVMLLQAVTNSASLLAATGRVDITFKFTVASMAIMLPSMMVGSYLGNIIGVAISILLVRGVLFLVHYRFVIRRTLQLGLRQYARCAGEGVLCAASMAGLVLLLDRYAVLSSPALKLSMLIGLGVAIYSAAIYWTNKELLLRMIKNRSFQKT